MILILLAALFGAAQETIVVYKDATTSHSVDTHFGSKYKWSVYINFSPDVEAPPENYRFIGSSDSDKIQIQWLNTGIYYLKVTETDLKGCENLKALPVRVISNDRSIGFLTTAGSSCYSSDGNGFNLPLLVSGSTGLPLTENNFPLVVEFMFNGKGFSQQVAFDNQVIQIPDDWITADPEIDFKAKVEITKAKDVQNIDIIPDVNTMTHIRIIQPPAQIEFGSSEILVEQGTETTHEVDLIVGNPQNAVYHWSVYPINGTTTDLNGIDGSAATIVWDGPAGTYRLFAVVTTENGCVSDTVSQLVEISETSDFFLSVGKDTVVGGCKMLQLQAVVTDAPGVSHTYSWSPAIGLDNPAIANPVFTPGNTTTFVVTVSSSKGDVATDSVKVTVSKVFADAGKDVLMSAGSTVLLDATKSSGSGLAFNWTTTSGKIESGSNSSTPVVSDFGDYYLLLTDEFGCTDRDTVNVSRLAHAPVAFDDNDTTAYQREIIIDVLANDTDQENSINPSSLTITNPPFHGTAYVEFDTHKIHYRPNTGFRGSDVFEYRICNTLKQCDEANVYVFVSDFKFLVPNAFSPNGDGVNDYFEIPGIEYYENNSLTIINRWGNKVYEAKNYGISTNPKFWDGKSNTGFRIGDDDLPAGTYFYILNLGNGEKAVSGSIYLDR